MFAHQPHAAWQLRVTVSAAFLHGHQPTMILRRARGFGSSVLSWPPLAARRSFAVRRLVCAAATFVLLNVVRVSTPFRYAASQCMPHAPNHE